LGCGGSSRSSPADAVVKAEGKKGIHVETVACLEQERPSEYWCSVELGDGRRHYVTVSLSDGRAIIRASSKTLPGPSNLPKRFHEFGGSEAASRKSYEEKSKNLPSTVTTG
jgi:hypothetical protein